MSAPRDDKNNSLPERRGVHRLLGVSPDGHRVNNVTDANRFEVSKARPWIRANLMDKTGARLLAKVYIPNTRERPDIVSYRGDFFEVVDTTKNPAVYRKAMHLAAEDNPPRKELPDDETEQNTD